MSNSRVDSFWDAALEGEELDHSAYLEDQDEELGVAVNLHRMLRETGKRWRTPEMPRNLGDFEVVGHLGSGGLGRVYLAWDPELRRHVAIKVIERDRWAMNEARSIAQLDHRAVVKVFEVGHDRVVMELLNGGCLKDEIEALGAGEESHLFDLQDRLHCLLRIAEGLAYCHERGVLHRDVKPGNVLFAEDDPHPRLIDFGLAHAPGSTSLDITQNLVGSPAYVAPEQVEMGATGADPRSDLFSFGVLAYELLTLRNPFLRETRQLTLEAVREARPPAPRRLVPDLPKSVQHIVLHCLEFDPRHRYQEMKEVVGDLRDVLANRPISVGRPSVLQHASLWYRRNRRLTHVGLSGVAAAALVGIGLWGNSVHAARNEILEGVSGVDVRIPELSDTAEFHEAGLDLFEAQLHGEQFDRGRIAPLLFGPLTPEIDETIESWSKRLGEAAGTAEASEPETFPAEAWKAVFQLEEDICPESDWNHEFRDRGRLVLLGSLADEPNLRLLKQVVRGSGREQGYRDLREVPLSAHLPRGYYRLEIPGEWERDFVHSSVWGPSHRIERGPRRIPAEELRGVPELDGVVFSELITNRQYREFCEATGSLRPNQLRGPAEASFRGSWDQAQAFVAWAGGRLPATEAIPFLIQSAATLPEAAIGGEYVSDVAVGPISSCLVVNYQRMLEASGAPPMAWIHQIARSNPIQFGEGSKAPGSGFRVAYPR